jgi:hypothetical protein
VFSLRNTKVTLRELQTRQSIESNNNQPDEPQKKKGILKATKIVPPTSSSRLNDEKQRQKHQSDEESEDDDDDVRLGVGTVRPKTAGASFHESPQYKSKELTPKERLLMNKLKKADQEAMLIGQVAKENYEERILRESLRREATIHASNVNEIKKKLF